MSSNTFTKENLNEYLKELAKEFVKLNGKQMPAEIVLVGGAAIIANYGFRDSTTDIDAAFKSSSAMGDAIRKVADKFDLPVGWINDDFKNTSSYSTKLFEISEHYRTFSNIVDVRIVKAENLVAMKLESAREYKNDYSDIVGILKEHAEIGEKLTLENIKAAYESLYGSWDKLNDKSKDFIVDVMKDDKYIEMYSSIRSDEVKNKQLLKNFEEDYPKVLNADNLSNILASLKEKEDEQDNQGFGMSM